MEETNYSNQPQNVNPQYSGQPGLMPVPNSVGVLVLGILSIVFCFCYGIIGLILGIIALVLAGKGISAYKENPGAYTLSSYNNLKAGKICAIIGTCLSSLYFIFIIIYFAIIGAALTAMPWDQLMNH